MKHRELFARGPRVACIERSIAETFESELLPSLLDPLLDDLHVVRVDAAPNLATICVVVAPGTSDPPRNPTDVETALARCSHWLRRQLCASVRLKRVPAIQLRYLDLPLWDRKGGEH